MAEQQPKSLPTINSILTLAASMPIVGLGACGQYEMTGQAAQLCPTLQLISLILFEMPRNESCTIAIKSYKN
ncbi:MAG: hypothetical protein KME20_18760 [Kaiparowitsia implicata GSE-PSE-MK54-09C]|jgi:hypothetical protein|nr:hypothetical protein [Kaiparowitsia implicata GSE-PSE-MK54-09C]